MGLLRRFVLLCLVSCLSLQGSWAAVAGPCVLDSPCAGQHPDPTAAHEADAAPGAYDMVLRVRDEIAGRLPGLVGIRDVDVVILNDAPPHLARHVVLDGIRSILKDLKIRANFTIGGITSLHVDMLEEGTVRHLMHGQLFEPSPRVIASMLGRSSGFAVQSFNALSVSRTTTARM